MPLPSDNQDYDHFYDQIPSKSFVKEEETIDEELGYIPDNNQEYDHTFAFDLDAGRGFDDDYLR